MRSGFRTSLIPLAMEGAVAVSPTGHRDGRNAHVLVGDLNAGTGFAGLDGDFERHASSPHASGRQVGGLTAGDEQAAAKNGSGMVECRVHRQDLGRTAPVRWTPGCSVAETPALALALLSARTVLVGCPRLDFSALQPSETTDGHR